MVYFNGSFKSKTNTLEMEAKMLSIAVISIDEKKSQLQCWYHQYLNWNGQSTQKYLVQSALECGRKIYWCCLNSILFQQTVMISGSPSQILFYHVRTNRSVVSVLFYEEATHFLDIIRFGSGSESHFIAITFYLFYYFASFSIHLDLPSVRFFSFFQSFVIIFLF